MRAFTERVYGIPPEQVVGSSGVVKFQLRPDGKPVLLKDANIEFVDDGPGKPVGINRFIGRRPIFAFGNSDGDQQMLEWTAAGNRARFMGLVHHTDAEREWAYDRQSPVGRLNKAWDEAMRRGWTVTNMKSEWKKIFSFRTVRERPGQRPCRNPVHGSLRLRSGQATSPRTGLIDHKLKYLTVRPELVEGLRLNCAQRTNQEM